jgi:hypothetical protein
MNKGFNFSTNWNNKLDNNAFTTLRMSSRIQIGEVVEISLKKEFKYFAECIDRKKIKVNQINEFIAYIDTGYSKEECINIIKRMYKNVPNIENSFIYLYLFKQRKIKR